MKKKSTQSKLKKLLISSILLANCFMFSSCSPYFWMAFAAGLMGTSSSQTSGTYNPYASGTPFYSTPYDDSSSSVSSTPRKCSRCNGTGLCQKCGGTGRIYDWGTMSIVSEEKYEQRCGLCNGSGKCGVCDGKGFF